MINYDDDPLFWQRFLESAGFYHGALDGDFGQQSHVAAEAFEARSAEIAKTSVIFDIRTESNIQTLHPTAQLKARIFLRDVTAKLAANSLAFKIISGTRTYEEQNELYALGRTRPGKIVTKARGGYSNHNFGVAWDIGIFKNGEYIEESELYKSAGVIGKQQGLEWGGDWESFQDEPHFQVVAETQLSEIRTSFEKGRSFIV
ncbi:MAG: M15 family metallopeptidase [Verrucomicrobia bacterium]|nr:M15 family metallopeptidase [Verrucomicrobiota bacterium]